LDDQRRDGGTNSTLRTKEQGTHLTLNEHDDDFTHLEDLGLLSVLVHQMVRGVHHLPSNLGDLVVQDDLANLKGHPILVRLEIQEDLYPPSLQEDLRDQATLDCPVDLAILLSQVHLHKTDNSLK